MLVLFVLTVPMRNGNLVVVAQERLLMQSSYRTYEEWKLTLTMKDDNVLNKFLPYLWGMETLLRRFKMVIEMSSYRTYEEWKLLSIIFMKHIYICSYRTYEEWKLSEF